MVCKYKREGGVVPNKGWCKLTGCRCAKDFNEECPIVVKEGEKDFLHGFILGVGITLFIFFVGLIL